MTRTPRGVEKVRQALAAFPAFAVSCALGGCGSGENDEPPDDRAALGALLPYTGPLAGLGGNVEKALFMLQDSVNAAGGLLGGHFSVILRDTHGDLDRGRAAGEELLANENVLGLIGPEESDLAVQLQPLVIRSNAIELLPGDASPNLTDPEEDDRWFVTGPSAAAVAGALVDRMRDDGIDSLLIWFEPDAYGAELNRLLTCQFQAEGGESVRTTPLVGSLSEIVSDLAFSTHDAIALITRPETGAEVVVEQTVVGARPARWYLAPTLDSAEFRRNVLPTSLESATGISPALEPFHEEFAASYRSRWGESPLTATYYYYDSAVIWALAVEAAAAGGTTVPSPDAIAEAVREVSAPPGEIIGWDEVERGLRLVREGRDVDYQGVSGPLDIGESGEASQSILRFWETSDGSVEYEPPADYSQTLAEQCL